MPPVPPFSQLPFPFQLTSTAPQIYYHMQDAVWSAGGVQLPAVSPGVPENLQTPRQRAQTYNERPCTMWVRTWYGNVDVDRN
jgi:hypothetical protein